MDRIARLAALVLVAAACAPAATAPAPSVTVQPTVPVHGTPAPTSAAKHTPRVGGCTSAQATSRQLLDRYFSLTTTGDVGAVLDCFAAGYGGSGADLEFSATRWANAGPLSSLTIAYVDTVKGCDRYDAQYQFKTPDPLFPGGFRIFYSVGPESGVMRIFDGGTGLASADATRVSCGP